jgi:acyl-CoA thioester hydrolase
MARTLAFTLRIPIRWGDMDAMGHVNNTLYFRYMEEARTTWYDSMDINDNGAALPKGCGPVIVNAGCTFFKALRYPGEVEVKLFIDQPGKSSVLTIYEMRAAGDPDTLCAEGTAKAVWIDMEKEKSIPLPDAVRALLDVQA